MAFKSVMGSSSEGSARFVKCKDCKPGQVMVEGVYKEKKPNQFGTTEKPKFDYVFEDKDGLVTLNGTGHIDYGMDRAAIGDVVKVVYIGSEVMKKGANAGKLAHKVDVQVDDAGAPF